ncbi:hypothetical protein KSS94_02985 [Pseudomonas fakonensis]|uniref:YD repeat-containing protein n=1 Tax=Pseudomonas fakonensis TaxID=2842355 RepID=A0ABX8N6Y3_9PSED|nr:hypothetical protein [Pseudomonas fakonensis]QXH52119.1 hypothetical protein KSS94_02985 [Pseudomonas fakonensis]
MTNVYKQDLGNGVVIYADDHVKTGKWVYDCSNGLLISRQPLAVPIPEIQKVGMLTIDDMYDLRREDIEPAKTAIRFVTADPEWYKDLRYHSSGLSEDSELRIHEFDLITHHANKTWALRVMQYIEYDGTSSFSIRALYYDPHTYMNYAKSLEAALKSCPTPQ